jgi:replicative DNA helicase
MNEPRIGLPRSEEAEAAILGAFLRYGHLVKITKLDRDDFYSERNRTVFEAMQALASQGSVIDITTVSERLRRDRRIDSVGGDVALMDLADSVVSSVGWEGWEKIVLQKAMLRSAIQIARNLNDQAFADDRDPDEIVADMAAAVGALSRRCATGEVTTWQQAYQQAMTKKEQSPAIPSGIEFLDSMLSIRPGQLGIIAGRPGDGKSAIATQILTAIGRTSECLLCTLEMTPEEVAQRMLAQITDVPIWQIDAMEMGMESYQKVRACENALDVKFCSTQTVAELRAVALTRKAQGKLKMVVVDYLQLMRVKRPSSSRNEDVSAISRDLKLLAGELQVPVIALSQFSRDAAKSPPEVHHLRDSGAIEQDADWIVFVYTAPGEAGSGVKQIRLAKNRRGAIHNPFAVYFDGTIVKFGGKTV